MSDQVQQTAFSYEALDEETRQFVQRKTDEIHGLLKRTAENIIKIGQHLQMVKERLPHGQFLSWIETEFAMSRWTAQNFMRVADKFGNRWGNFPHMPVSVLYELAVPSTPDTILEQVQSGYIAPTLDAVRAAKETERQAREAEQQAIIEQLTRQIEELQERIALQATPEIQVREVEKYVEPPEVVAQLEGLHQQVKQLTTQRDALTQQLAKLAEEARATALKRDEDEQDRRIRLHWFRLTNTFQASLRALLAEWPSPLDTQAFEAGDWARLAQIKALARRFLEECDILTGGGQMVVDGSSAPPKAPE